MKRTQQVLAALVIAVLMLSPTLSVALAQDDLPGGITGPNTMFIPFASQGNGADQGASEPITSVPDTISAISTERVEKDAVAGTATPQDQFRLVSLIVVLDSSIDAGSVQGIPNAEIVHRYKHVFNGVSVLTPSENVESISQLSGVSAVYLDTLQQPDTEVSPGFIGAPTVWNALGGQTSAGETVVVGVLDSGIWPEHPSFSDPDPSGKPYPPAPGGPYACQFGSTVTGDAPFTCNNKLVGAYRFMATYDAVIGLLPNEFKSARDDNGHGTHTSSTAAGNAGVSASIYGIDRGKVSGIAPRARVIMYKVCGDQGCFQSDSVAAVDQAIQDKVNAINFSISGGNTPYSDAVELAFLKAYDNGIFVAASAGNSGPGANTVSHRGPWVTTVAASTSNRYFLSTITLTASNGDTLTLSGATVTDGISTPTPVVTSPDTACNPMAAGTFNGEIVVCPRIGARLSKGYNIANAGGGGMILYNTTQLGILTDNHFLPSVHVDQADGVTLQNFMATHTGVMGVFTRGAPGPALGDMMASFSSRGGPAQVLGVNKPDVTAPGVQILAGTTPMGATPLSGAPGQLFQSIQGTSMSSPHVAGAGALLKALHPDWTPGQIKSALMTTAKTSVVREDGVTPATPYDDGAGRIDLNKAGAPLVTMDETAANYAALKDSLWNANYPSFYHPGLPGAITVQRTLRNVTDKKVELVLSTTTDQKDWKIVVSKELKAPANGAVTFDITIDARSVPLGQSRHGAILLKKGNSTLHIPVSFVRGQANVTISKTCTPATFKEEKGSTACTITMQNTTFNAANVAMTDRLPKGMKIVPGTLVGGVQPDKKTVTYSGALAGAQPPQVAVALDPNATVAGYLPLSTFGVGPISGVGDETISNFNVPGFMFGGTTNTRLGLVSNGYIVVGGGTGGDINFVNTDLPDGAAPNNVLAPFWTDLNPAFGGVMRIGTLTDGVNTWIVAEWDGVANYSDRKPNDFQVWIRTGNVEDITFVYGPNTSNGEGGVYTVGAENIFGNSGGAIFYNGDGAPPTPTNTTGYTVKVTSVAGAPGAAATVSFSMKSDEEGPWQNCAELTSPSFQGVAISCAQGKVVD
ncbi:MAG: S8 family serine peptidase [Anaerolineales bacterium]|nr:S8 family serine peptidase [Anaerolineales bacterium]